MSEFWRVIKYALFLCVASTLLCVVMGRFGAVGGVELMVGLTFVVIPAVFLFCRMLRLRDTSACRSPE